MQALSLKSLGPAKPTSTQRDTPCRRRRKTAIPLAVLAVFCRQEALDGTIDNKQLRFPDASFSRQERGRKHRLLQGRFGFRAAMARWRRIRLRRARRVLHLLDQRQPEPA